MIEDSVHCLGIGIENSKVVLSLAGIDCSVDQVVELHHRYMISVDILRQNSMEADTM